MWPFASSKSAVNTVKKYGTEMQASKVTQEPCGRCGTAIEKNAFCPACRDFFRGLSHQNAESPNAARGMQKHYSRVGNK
jgi:hypothetical protein